MIHLLCGPSGAGKTTHAQTIAREKEAIRLSIDECLKPLNIPNRRDWAYAQTVLIKAEQCAGQILNKAKQLLAQNKDVVLDVATFRRIERDKVRAWAKNINSQIVLYYVSASLATRRKRVLNRNAEKGKAYSFEVPEWWFDLAEKAFEPPSEDEAAIIVDNESAHSVSDH
jgi:predicted kinase